MGGAGGVGAFGFIILRMLGKANIRRRKRIEQGRRRVAPQQELKRRQKAAVELEIAEIEERSKIAEQE
jgi:hypothetical protein